MKKTEYDEIRRALDGKPVMAQSHPCKTLAATARSKEISVHFCTLRGSLGGTCRHLEALWGIGSRDWGFCSVTRTPGGAGCQSAWPWFAESAVCRSAGDTGVS